MKIIIIFLFLVTVSISKNRILPKSFDSNIELKPSSEIDFTITDTPNMNLVRKKIDSLEGIGQIPEIYGYNFSTNLNLKEIGTWEELPNGDRIWRYKIICPGAESINIGFKDFQLSENSHLSFYSENKVLLLGPYSKRVNKDNGIFGSHLIDGESMIVELYEPNSEIGLNRFIINKIVYGFSRVNPKKKSSNKLQSLSCNVNVNCPIGDELCREKQSVCRILLDLPGGLSAWCSGSLINNTNNDKTPYILSAFHCLDANSDNSLSTSEKNNLNIWVAQFGYMREYCSNGFVLPTFEYSGADFRSGWSGTDFLLVELQEQPKSGENNFVDVYFSGWDRTGNTPNSAKSLHHPDGDIMKISYDEDALGIVGFPSGFQCGTYPSGNNYWQIDWEHGTTEGGSSGSPLFNPNNHIIGQLWGGCDCNSTANESAYGRLSISWDGGGTSSTRLKDWLDPLNTGQTTLDGIKTDLLIYGVNYDPGVHSTKNAYSTMKLGSRSTSGFSVKNGAEISFKAGESIVIRSCSQFKAGSEVRLFIEEPNCSDLIKSSYKESDYDGTYCSSNPKISIENQNKIETFTDTKPFLTISPNPTNSSINIEYVVAESGLVSLELYDNIGSKMLTLIDNKQIDAGTYNTTQDLANYSSGQYLLVLKINGDNNKTVY